MTCRLTNRQTQIIQLLAAGYEPKEAAAQLNLTLGSVKQYLFAARKQNGARTTVNLVAMWAREALSEDAGLAGLS